MMVNTDMKIKGILDRGFDVPSIFKSVLRKESGFTKDEEILDLVLLEREYYNEREDGGNVCSRAELLIATSHGIIHVEEGLDEVEAGYLGYKIRHTMYGRISCIELDMCCLLGIFKIAINTDGKNEIAVKFNTARYRSEFEAFINTVRKKMIENSKEE